MERSHERSVAQLGRARGARACDAPAPDILASEVARLGELGIAAAATCTDGIVRSWNRAAIALLGVGERDIVGRPIASLSSEPVSEERAVAMLERLCQVGAVGGEFDVDSGWGTRRRLDVRVRAVEAEGGTLQGYLIIALDMTRVAQAERVARRSEGELQLARQIPNWGSWEWHAQEDRLDASERLATLLGLNPGERVPLEVALAAMPPEDRARVSGSIEAVLAGAVQRYSTTYRLRGGDGQVRWFDSYSEAWRDADGSLLGVRGIAVDVTERVAAQDEAFLQASLLDEIDAAVIQADLDGVVLTWNKGAEQCYGWSRAEAVGRNVRELIIGPESVPWELTEIDLEREGRWEGEYVKRRKDGSAFPAYVRHRAIHERNGRRIGVVSVSMDVSQRRETERELRTARNYLRAVTDSMGQALYTAGNDGCIEYVNPVALELLGWSLDELKGKVAHDVVHSRRPDGGPYPIDECPIANVARTGEPVRVPDDVFIRRDGRELPVAYTAAPITVEDGTEGCVIVFEDITERKAESERLERELDKLSWLGRVRDALANDRFVLHAQPIVDLASGEVVQRELLLRMRGAARDGEPERLVMPGDFLPVAEEFGLIGEIDRWVVDRSAELAATGVPVELNVSARSLCDPALLRHIHRALERTGADPRTIVFELTETAILSDAPAAQLFIEELHAMGCKVALDDFGTGYGGFTYLKQLPTDYLKIDMEFVRDLLSNDASRNVVEAIVILARGFGVMTVAEGVEDAETLELLRELGVDQAQGYHLGRPAPLEPAAPAGDAAAPSSAGQTRG